MKTVTEECLGERLEACTAKGSLRTDWSRRNYNLTYNLCPNNGMIVLQVICYSGSRCNLLSEIIIVIIIIIIMTTTTFYYYFIYLSNFGGVVR